jgi:pimeloyl-ACP methyl ester carboxylesterase
MVARSTSLVALLTLELGLATPVGAGEPIRVQLQGVELHYTERGEGVPIVLLHGGMGDYQSWGPQLEAFSRFHRVISYSRRYNYPNRNPLTTKDHSALVEAQDLAALLARLELGPVHLVGQSYGAFTALALAMDHPQMVRSMVLAEPPVLQWTRGLPDGDSLYSEFMGRVMAPARDAFVRGDAEQAMRALTDGISGTVKFDSLPPAARADRMRNSRAMEALAISTDPFPNLPKERARQLRVPVLIVTGENTIAIHKRVNEELSRLLPNVEMTVIPAAGHVSHRENPQAFNEAVLKFLTDSGGRLAGCPPSALSPLVVDGQELHASLATRPLEDTSRLHVAREVLRDNPYLSTDAEFVDAIARGASQGRLGGEGVRAALYALYLGESEVGLYGLEAASTAEADQLEGAVREIWAYTESLGRARVHREGDVLVVVWNAGVSPSCWEAVNAGVVERLTAR